MWCHLFRSKELRWKTAWRWRGVLARKSGSDIGFRSIFTKPLPAGRNEPTWKYPARQFEGLREEMKRDHNRLPDVGEPKLHPTAGATVVGARKFLIAYNVNLNTSDVGIANKIAKAIRFSSGGLRYVKSMGVELKARNLAQVSINLTDFEQTPMHRVYEMVKREAARYGAAPVGSEIVGLIPKKAIEMATDYFLQWRISHRRKFSKIDCRLRLLTKLWSRRQKRASWPAWRNRFWKPSRRQRQHRAVEAFPALAGALAASLGQMVAGLSRKKKSQAAFVNSLSEALDQLRRNAAELAEAIDRDAASYDAVMSAYKLPQESAEEKRTREEAIQRATRGAAEVPLQVAERSVALFERLGQLASIAAASMKSDLEVARLLAAAGARGALANVEINLDSIAEAGYVASMRAKSVALRERLAETSRSISA